MWLTFYFRTFPSACFCSYSILKRFGLCVLTTRNGIYEDFVLRVPPPPPPPPLWLSSCLKLQSVHHRQVLLCLRHFCLIPAPVLCPHGLPGAGLVQPNQTGQTCLQVPHSPQEAAKLDPVGVQICLGILNRQVLVSYRHEITKH